MPLYFFHLYDGADWLADEEGIELADAASIPEIAAYQARDVMAADVRIGLLDMNLVVEVDDEWGQRVHILQFADALKIAPGAVGPPRERKKTISASSTRTSHADPRL